MRHGSVSSRAEIDLPRFRLCVRDELFDRIRGNGRMHENQHRRRGDHRYRLEIPGNVVREASVYVWRGRESGAGYQDGVSVGIRLGDDVRTNGAAGPRAIIDHDLLSQAVREMPSDQPPDDVVRAGPGWKRHDQSNRAGGVSGAAFRGLSHGQSWCRAQGQKQKCPAPNA